MGESSLAQGAPHHDESATLIAISDDSNELLSLVYHGNYETMVSHHLSDPTDGVGWTAANRAFVMSSETFMVISRSNSCQVYNGIHFDRPQEKVCFSASVSY
jgi:hypothetical protein